MVKREVVRLRLIEWNKVFSVLLLVALLLPLMVMAPAPKMTPRAQPVLLAMAAERPEETVRVIVQKLVKDTTLEALVARLGGVVTKDLWIINAFAAELPAGAVPKLSRAAGVRWVSLDAPVVKSGGGSCPAAAEWQNVYTDVIGAVALGEEGLNGESITVAVIDSGLRRHPDFRGRFDKVNFTDENLMDKYGHGTHVTGIIGGDGRVSEGAYVGVAPGVDILSVKVSDRHGGGTISTVVAGLQWVYDNKDLYNIRVVNMSLNSSVPESYHTSPLDAALEILWFNGVVVVVSGGNNGDDPETGILYPPANDPFAITVGAADDMGTADISDDILAPFSAFGTTYDGFAKPDLVAPGVDIISTMAGEKARLYKNHSDHFIDCTNETGGKYYFRMSGTSMAAGVVTGAVALLLQDEPGLTPDQVKHRLMATARPFGTGSGAGYLDAYAAVHGTTTESANTGTEASQLLWTGDDPVTWDSVNWNSVNWNSVNWNSVNWNSVNWNSVNWNSVHWDD